jgi:hypothetical protein
MKYKDKAFLKYQDRQRNGEADGHFSRVSERQIRREREHRHYIFFTSHINKYFDKYWWNNLKAVDRDEIISLYGMQRDFLSSKSDSRWYSGSVFEDMNDWVVYIKENFKPNKITLREDKLKVLGI